MPSADTILLAVICIANAVTAYFSYRAKSIGEKNHEVGLANHALAVDIQTNTNGMQTALIKSADAAGRAAGLKEGRAEIR
jgi:hypothetical protein